MKAPAALLLYLALSMTCAAQAVPSYDREFFVLSEGASTCGEYVAEPEKQTVRAEWVLGYISGRNMAGATHAERNAGQSVQRVETVIGWLLSYCQSHSLEPMAAAAEAFRMDLLRHEGSR